MNDSEVALWHRVEKRAEAIWARKHKRRWWAAQPWMTRSVYFDRAIRELRDEGVKIPEHW
jgi:hypothetical protein